MRVDAPDARHPEAVEVVPQPRRTIDGGFDVAILVADESLFRRETFFEELGDRRASVR